MRGSDDGTRLDGQVVAGVNVAGVNVGQVLREQGVLVSTTVGVSMFPMLRNRRDTIVVRPLGAGLGAGAAGGPGAGSGAGVDERERLAVGDVALYAVHAGRADGVAAGVGDAGSDTGVGVTAGSGTVRYVLHRVVGVHDGWYAIRGDNCLTTEHVDASQILGRLVEFYRGERHVVCDASRGYRLYWRFWLAIWPLRRMWKLARHAAGRFLRLFGWKGRRHEPL